MLERTKNVTHAVCPSWTRTCVIAAGFGLLFLGVAATPTLNNFFDGMGGTAVLASVRQSGLVPPLVLRVGMFLLVAVGLHIALGLFAAALTWLSEKNWPQLAAKRVQVTFLWFTVIAGWVFAANAFWFPRSDLVPDYARVVHHTLASIAVFQIFSSLLVLALALLCIRPLRSMTRSLPGTGKVRVAAIGATAIIVSLVVVIELPVAASRGTTKPNVIVIGADSLRLDELEMFGGSGATPVLDQELRKAHVLTDTITPLARTFPSWVSILSGRHPRTTGAWFNLMARRSVKPAPTIAHILKERGYRTVFATDEVRFSNIDHSYGFDTLITPVIGASDFVLGSIADMPLLNVVNHTAFGSWLFPDIHANRAADKTYRPVDFSARLAEEMDLNGPMLLTVHFTASHWPYTWAESPDLSKGDSKMEAFDQYQASIRIVDQQIGALLGLLRDGGVLDNAIVVFLSDHGEALARPGDSLIRSADAETTRRVVAQQRGHGTSVLSPSQYQVLLAFAGFGAQGENLHQAGSRSATPASLEDVAPTVLDLLDIGGTESFQFDGRSLAGVLTGGVGIDFDSRVRFTETDFTLPRMLAGDFNTKWLVEAGIPYYRVNASSGWVEIKEDRLAAMMANKERAAICGSWLLAALPAANDETLYAAVHRETGAASILNDPAGIDDKTLSMLYLALQARFPGELRRPSLHASTSTASATMSPVPQH